MSRKLIFKPITRIEGHAKVSLFVSNDGKVLNSYLQVTEFRGFEKLLINRPIEEAPLIVPRICGLCSPSHHLASVKALDDIFGLTIKENALKLRELLHFAGILHSHILHFFILYLPDILFRECDKNPGFLGMVKHYPSLVKQILEIRDFARQVIEILGGSSVHPSGAIPGGFLNSIKPSQQLELQEKSINSIKMIKEIIDNIEDKLTVILEDYDVYVPSNFVALYSNSTYPLYHSDDIRVISQHGELLTFFKYNECLKSICEKDTPWSYTKTPYILNYGYYRVGPLARFNVNDIFDSENSEAFVKRFLSNRSRPLLTSNYYNIIRVAEIIYVLDKMFEILNNKCIQEPSLPQKNLRVKNNEGLGVIEAPRGTLIHYYKVDNEGYICDANLIVATVQNIPVIEKEIAAISESIISKEGLSEERLYSEISKLIRNYDPCLSCATHTYEFPLILEIYIENMNSIIRYPKKTF
ncbi:MAG: Ni/Fe hydrogenase subunit alpha [Candidatus Methanomethylicia archaeon]